MKPEIPREREFGEALSRFLGYLVFRPSKEEILASAGARYRKNGNVTAFGVFLYYWDTLID